MTNVEFLFQLQTAIKGRKGFSIAYDSVNIIRLYSDTDNFTAIFIDDVLNQLRDCFTGICVNAAGRPYLLFNI